jgi:hypothetical protein
VGSTRRTLDARHETDDLGVAAKHKRFMQKCTCNTGPKGSIESEDTTALIEGPEANLQSVWHQEHDPAERIQLGYVLYLGIFRDSALRE